MTDTIALKRTLEVLHASDGTTYILRGGADAEFKIEESTPRERDLLDLLLVGAPSAADLRERLSARGHDVEPRLLDDTLEELAGLGLLEEPPAAPALGEVAAERYDRQLAYFADLRPGESVALQQRLGAARVAMIGVGGLGTWTAAALACAGVGHLTLIDDDRVELSNLNRQFLYRHADLGRLKAEAAADALAAFDPELELEVVPNRVSGPRDAERVAAAHDLVVELADRPPHELSRWLDAACWDAGTTRISAAQFPPLVRIGPTYVPGRTACLLCQERGARDGFPLYDEFVAMRQARLPVTSTLGSIAAMIGAAVAGDVVHHLTGLMEPASLGAALILDVRDLSVRREPIQRQPDCPRCGEGTI
jgi:bacteriocin biosynthesis cyclodehydratase domain-containing protein